MAERIFRAIYHQSDPWIRASTPDVRGAYRQGTTREEAREDLRAAILLMLEVIEEDLAEDDGDVIYREDMVTTTG